MENQKKNRKFAAKHLMKAHANYIINEDTGRAAARVDMAGGKYLCFERSQVAGFKNIEECLDYIGY